MPLRGISGFVSKFNKLVLIRGLPVEWLPSSKSIKRVDVIL